MKIPFKRIIAVLLTISMLFSLFLFSAGAIPNPVAASADFWGWIGDFVDEHKSDAGFVGLSDAWTAMFSRSDEGCTSSSDRFHDWRVQADPATMLWNAFTVTCFHCGVNYADFCNSGGGFTSNLSSGLDVSSSGITAYGTGFEIVQEGNEDVAIEFARSQNLYALASASPVGSFYLIGCNDSSFGGVTSWTGLAKQYNTVFGVDVISAVYTSSLGSYLSSNFPLGTFITGLSQTTDRTAFGDSSTTGWFGYPNMLCLNYADAVSVYEAYKSGDVSVYGKYIFYFKPDSYYEPYFAYSSPKYQHCCRFYNIGRITLSTGSVDTTSGSQIISQVSSTGSSRQNGYGLIPGSYDVSSYYPVTTRPTSLMQSINEYNITNSITNYYISPTGSDDLYSPALYDEETLVYTDPVTGTEYLTNGWKYDYLTRCYTLDMADDSFTIGSTVIDTIKLTYGDEHLTVEHYSGSTLVQTDEYNYMITADSNCNLYGHSYTYETTKEPTCTAVGERKYTCSGCGDQYAEEISANGHSYSYSVMTPPSCASPGTGLYTCDTCGTESTERIPALEHTPKVVEVSPPEYDEHGTLISPGYTLYRCSVCGQEYTEEEDVPIEEESWFSWLGSLFKKLISSIVNGLASGLEWVIDEVLVTTVGWIIKAVEWVFGLFNGEHLTTLFNWFSFEHEAWVNEFSDPTAFMN